MVDYQFDPFENPYPPAGFAEGPFEAQSRAFYDALPPNPPLPPGMQAEFDAAMLGGAPDAASVTGRSSLPVAGSGSTGTTPTLDFRPGDLQYQRELPTSFGLDTSPWGGVLDSLAESFANTNYGRVRGFGANFLKGATQGFATSRGKVMQQREKDREYELEYARRRNEANLQATKDAQERRQRDLEDRLKRSRDLRDYGLRKAFDAAAATDDGKFITITSDALLPYLPGYKVGDKVPISTFNAVVNDYNAVKNPKPQASAGIQVTPQAQKVVDAVKSGRMNPNMLSMLSRSGTMRDQIAVGLAEAGVDVNELQLNYEGEKRFWSTQNSPRFVAIRQNGSTLLHTLDRAEQAYKDLRKILPSVGVSSLNKAQLAILRTRNDGVGAAARRLDVLVSDVVPEIGAMIMGGNSNTDHSLELAAHNLNGDWNEAQFLDAIQQARLTTNTRLAAMSEATPATPKSTGPVASMFATLNAKGIKTVEDFDRMLGKKRTFGGTLEDDLRKKYGFGDDEVQELRNRFSEAGKPR